MYDRLSSPEGLEFNQGTRLAESLVKFLPQGKIVLSSIDWLIMGSFSSIFPIFGGVRT